MDAQKGEERRLEPLDALRGMAALGVAFYHYQHFGGDARQYPWASIEPAKWLYARGWMLVDFFFLLSGIVFTYKYFEPLIERKLSGKAFFFLRLVFFDEATHFSTRDKVFRSLAM